MVDIPKFWTWAHIRLEKFDYLRKWENNDRIRKLVRNIIFTCWGDMSDEPLSSFWDKIINCEIQLKSVNFSKVYLSNLDPRTIAKSLVKIEEVNLNYPYDNYWFLCDKQLYTTFPRNC